MIHEKQKPKEIKKEWGSELIIANNNLYCGKVISVGKEWSSGGKYHKHIRKDETFYALIGETEIEIIVEEKEGIHSTVNFWLLPGQTYQIEPGLYHRFRSPKLSQSVFIEISTYDDPQDNYYCEIEWVGDKRKPHMKIKEVER